jgi:hypothetical protein
MLVIILAILHVFNANASQTTAAISATGGPQLMACTPCNHAEFGTAVNAFLFTT